MEKSVAIAICIPSVLIYLGISAQLMSPVIDADLFQ